MIFQTPQEKKCICYDEIERFKINTMQLGEHFKFCPLYTPPAQKECSVEWKEYSDESDLGITVICGAPMPCMKHEPKLKSEKDDLAYRKGYDAGFIEGRQAGIEMLIKQQQLSTEVKIKPPQRTGFELDNGTFGISANTQPPQPKESETNKIKEYSKFIECKDCTITTMNDDDNVCLKCGSKNTKRLFMDNNNFKKFL